MTLAILKPIIWFWYKHSQNFRIAIVVAQDEWQKGDSDAK